MPGGESASHASKDKRGLRWAGRNQAGPELQEPRGRGGLKKPSLGRLSFLSGVCPSTKWTRPGKAVTCL